MEEKKLCKVHWVYLKLYLISKNCPFKYYFCLLVKPLFSLAKLFYSFLVQSYTVESPATQQKHCAKQNLNLCSKTLLESAWAVATVYVGLLFTYQTNQTPIPLTLCSNRDRHVFVTVFSTWCKVSSTRLNYNLLEYLEYLEYAVGEYGRAAGGPLAN